MRRIHLLMLLCSFVFISEAYSEIINPIGTKLIQPSGGVYRHGDTMEFVFADDHLISGETFIVTWRSLARSDIHFRLRYSLDQQRWTTIADDIPVSGVDDQGRAMGQSSWDVPTMTRNRKCWLKVLVFNESHAMISVYQKECFIRVTAPSLVKCSFSTDGVAWRNMLSNDYSSTTLDADGNRRFTWQVDLGYPKCIAKGYIKIAIKDSSGSNMGNDSTLGESKTTFYTDWVPSIVGSWVGSFTSVGVGTYNATGTISHTKYSYDKFVCSWQTPVGTSTLVGDIFMESCLSMDSKLRVPMSATGTAYAPPGYVWGNGRSSMQVDLVGYSKHPDFNLLWGTWDAEDYQHGSFSIRKQ